MASSLMVIIEIGIQHTSRMLFIENDNVVKAVSPDWADKPFAIGILPWNLKSSFYFFYSRPTDSIREHSAVDPIVVPYEILWCTIPWECLYDLLRCPRSSRVLGYLDLLAYIQGVHGNFEQAIRIAEEAQILRADDPNSKAFKVGVNRINHFKRHLITDLRSESD